MADRPRRHQDDLCARCRKNPRQIEMLRGKRRVGSYCRTCRAAMHRESRARNRIGGDHAKFAWRRGPLQTST